MKLIAAALKRFKEDTSLQQTAKAWRDTGIDLSLFMASVSPSPIPVSFSLP